jgi:hypothetical protein
MGRQVRGGARDAEGRGSIENEHLTDVESPPPPPKRSLTLKVRQVQISAECLFSMTLAPGRGARGGGGYGGGGGGGGGEGGQARAAPQAAEGGTNVEDQMRPHRCVPVPEH